MSLSVHTMRGLRFEEGTKSNGSGNGSHGSPWNVTEDDTRSRGVDIGLPRHRRRFMCAVVAGGSQGHILCR